MTAPVAAAIAARHAELTDLLRAAGPDRLTAASGLPEWSRLTIVCHLRYGAAATADMIGRTLAGEPCAFYPGGRSATRPTTLRTGHGETVEAVVESFAETAGRLERVMADLGPTEWDLRITEPADQPDLGPVTLGQLALLRLTEVEVHGTDLDLGAGPWSEVFVSTALPMRFRWLATRRANHRAVDEAVTGRWRFVARDMAPERLDLTVAVDGSGPVTVTERADAGTGVADCTIAGSSAALLAFLLGRADPDDLDELDVDGPPAAARSFRAAFPGP